MNSTFHEKFPDDDDPAGLKHVANVHNKTNDNTITLLIYFKICCVDGCITILYIIHNRMQTIKII
jgi:hypothetical protein